MSLQPSSRQKPYVLVSWVATNNDPFDQHGEPGPTLTLLFDQDSPYRGRVDAAVLLYRSPTGEENNQDFEAFRKTRAAIRNEDPSITLRSIPWKADDPTDHHKIFTFLQGTMPGIRETYQDRTLVIHTSPGTPSMQTIWVLMGETGFIDPPFVLVKSYRKAHRRTRPPVVQFHVGLDTFYTRYLQARPSRTIADDQAIVWDPKRFQSERLRRLFAEAARFAAVKVPVLILGERGTGKTTLATWIRANSPFRKATLDKNWPAVPCGQYLPETMRSELFGYVKGAFTGATQTSDGLLARAHRDTLFLDEIGDISRDLQRLLIKVLEEKTYQRLGDHQAMTSDFRLLSATNLPLNKLKERLDPDFLDRISLLQLHLPALREIPEEIPWLWREIYSTATSRAQVHPRPIPETVHKEITSALQKHPLPGNLRDLFRVAYRTLAGLADPRNPVPPKELPQYALQALPKPSSPTSEQPLADLARCFADHRPLEPYFERTGTIPLKAFQQAFKAYCADQILALRSKRHLQVSDICDISERTLREWRRQERG